MGGKYRLMKFNKKLKHTNHVKNFDLKNCKVSSLPEPALQLLYRTTSPSQFLRSLAGYSVDGELFPLQNLSKDRLLDAKAVLENIKSVAQEREEIQEVFQQSLTDMTEVMVLIPVPGAISLN